MEPEAEPITISRKSALEREKILRAEAEALSAVGQGLSAELDLQKLVQKVTDSGLQLTGAAYAAFFYNVTSDNGESYLLYALSGAPREKFEKFGIPRNTPLFDVTFRGEGTLRLDDVQADPRYGRNAPHAGMPKGHLPVRSYMAVPVISGPGPVLGGLFFGHPEPAVFTGRAQRYAEGLAAHAAIAIENANLYGRLKQELAARDHVQAELARTKDELAAHVDALRQADRRKDEFIATLAHELRNPLAPLRNGLEVMKLAHDQPQLIEQTREIMEREIQHMVRLIDDLLDVSRITAGRFELRKTRLNLCAVLKDAIETSRPVIEEAGHALETDVPGEPIYIEGDDTRVVQIFTNLLNNAAKYTLPGGVIRVTLGVDAGQARVSVRDNGVGIPAEMLPHVFDMFAQVDRSLERTQGGLGIGLSIARRLARMHGGEIEGRSAGRGRGSEFTVTLPVLMSATSAVKPRAAATTAPAPQGHRILVVDDHIGSASIMRIMCTALGNEVRTAHNGLQAMEVAEAFRPDVIFMDIGMPNLNGYDACTQLRKQGWARGIVMVALTGWGQDADKRRAREAGFDYHLVKPVNPDTIRKLLTTLAEQAASA